MTRLRVALTTLAVLAVCLPMSLLGGSSAQATQPAETAAVAGGTSSETKQGEGRFSGLSVTVSQTEHLRNQVVEVSWAGGNPTPGTGKYSENFMQVMQCWGDEAAPKRENCQFGGLFNETSGFGYTNMRTIPRDGFRVDADEPLTPESGEVQVPFTSVSGETVTTVLNQFYDAYSTNEIPFGRTANDGTGREFFEVQTQREAPGLGCGARLTTGARDCWLVVVPRDDVEVNGQKVADLPEHQLESSPLSVSNFKHAISFRLDFEPLGVVCPIGAATRQMLGHEEITEAISRWQPALCGEAGAIYNLTQSGDDPARKQVTNADEPWMSIVADPVAAGDTNNRTLVYAPIAVDALGVALVVERVAKDEAPADVVAKSGTRVVDLKLSGRLVAKLLTQTYRAAVMGNRDHVADNPMSLGEDPEFLELNPEFAQLDLNRNLYAITNPLGLADSTRALWQWIAGNKAARDFMAGKADPWGTKVNPNYKGMSLDRPEFPRSDPGCITFPYSPSNQAPMCALEHLAYAADLHAAGRGAARGQNLATTTWDDSTSPGRYKVNAPQVRGFRAVLALVDTGTAARYQLPMARLENGRGEYVAPSSPGMTKALSAMKESGTPGVLDLDPDTEASGAYPLTQISYAVTAPALLSKDAAKDYGAFLKYAAGKGQTPGIAPGNLPAGYLPLTGSLRKQALEAAQQVIDRVGGEKPSTTPGSDDGGTDVPGGDDGSVGVPGAGEVPPGGKTPPTDEAAPVDDAISATSVTTPSDPVGGARFVLLAALVLCLVAGLARPLIPLLLSRRRAP